MLPEHEDDHLSPPAYVKNGRMLSICGSYDDTVSSSDYAATNITMIREW
jgi:hypothetical protein